MGLLGMALDAQGLLYVADMNGRVDRVDPRTGAQEVYATIPTSTDTSFTDMPGFVAFGGDGNLYVGDWSAPVVWRVPPVEARRSCGSPIRVWPEPTAPTSPG